MEKRGGGPRLPAISVKMWQVISPSRNRSKDSLSPNVVQVTVQWAGTIATVLVFWEAAGRLFRIRAEVLPTPSRILWEILRAWPRIWDDLLATSSEAFFGLLGAVGLGYSLALLSALNPWIARTLRPLMWIVERTPAIATAAFLLVWLGVGMGPKVFLVLLLCTVPILVQGTRGLRSLHPDLLDLARTLGLSEARTLLHFRMPASLPFFFIALRTASNLAVMGAAVGEYVGGERGLGHLLFQSTTRMNMPLVLASLCMLSITASMFYGAIALVERFAIPWHTQGRTDPWV